MENLETSAVIFILFLIAVGVARWGFTYFIKQGNQVSNALVAHNSTSTAVDDEYVFSQLFIFENEIIQKKNSHTGIMYESAYTYRYLMRPWFSVLLARYRYQSEISQKLRDDMIGYLALIRHYSVSSFIVSWSFSDEDKDYDLAEEW